MKRLAAIVLLSALAQPALAAEECTDEQTQALSEELFKIIEADPSKEENLEKHVATVEADYGGEPSPAQTCEALKKLIALVKAS